MRAQTLRAWAIVGPDQRLFFGRRQVVQFFYRTKAWALGDAEKWETVERVEVTVRPVRKGKRK